MKQTPLETVGMAVNGFSIALFFYLASILEAVPRVNLLAGLLRILHGR